MELIDIERYRNCKPIPREQCLASINQKIREQWKHRLEKTRSAKIRPLPGPAALAFTTGPIVAAGKLVRRVVPFHFAVLQAINSPILKMIEDSVQKREAKFDFSPQEQWETCYIFTADPKELYRLFQEKGVQAIREAATEEIPVEWDAAAVEPVMIAIFEQIKRHVQTAVRFAAELEAGGEVSFFRELTETANTPKE